MPLHRLGPRRTQRGQVLLIMALGTTVLCGAAAIAIDLGSGAALRRDLQAYADFASLAGARSLGGGTDAGNFVALQYLSRQLSFSPPSSSAPLTGSGGLPSCSAPTTGNCPAGTYQGRSTSSTITLTDSASTIDVSVSSSRSTLLAGVLGFSTVNVASSSRAGVGRRPCGICVLSTTNPSQSGALRVTGNGSVNISGGDVVDNSSASDASQLTGNGSIIAAPPASIGIVGGATRTGSGLYSPQPTTGVSPVSDPLSGVAAPTNSPALPIRGSLSTGVALPGVYSSISVGSTGVVTLTPGLYVFTGSGLSSTASGTITGTGVTLYFACSAWPTPCASGQSGSTLTLTGGGTTSISSCTTVCVSGAIAGLAVFADRSNTATMSFTGNGLVPALTGTVYALSGGLSMTGNAQLNLNSGLVVNTLTVTGNGDLDDTLIPGADVPGLTTGGTTGDTSIIR